MDERKGSERSELIDEVKRLGVRVSQLSLNVGIPYPLLTRKLKGLTAWDEGEEERVRQAMYPEPAHPDQLPT